MGLLECCPDFGIAFGRTESHDDVFGTEDGFDPWAKENGEIERGQSALADDYGMNELDGNVLRVGGVRTAAEGEQTAAAEKTLGHFAAGLGETRRLAREEVLEERVALQQTLFDVAGEFIDRCHSVRHVFVRRSCG